MFDIKRDQFVHILRFDVCAVILAINVCSVTTKREDARAYCK